jgi:hypothetical protein
VKQNNIIYIGGYGRSGSTILEKVLTAHPEITGGGEIFRMAEIFSDHKAMCTCGKKLIDCPVWGPVRIVAVKEAKQFGGLTGLHAALMRVEGRFDKRRLSDPKDVRAWVRLNRIAFKALRASSPSAIWVVDSSKTARGAARRPILLLEGGADIRFVRLIRPAKSVMRSVSKGTNRALEDNKVVKNSLGTTLQQQTHAYLGWIAANTVAEGISQKLGIRAVDLQFEDLTANPDCQIKRLTAWLGLTYPDGWEKRMIDVPRHMIGGNRNRFRQENVQRSAVSHKGDVMGDIGLGIGRSLTRLGVF